jgi:spore germination protein KC
MHFLVSKEATAKEIFDQKPITEDILSYELDHMIDEQESLSFAPDIEAWQFMNDLSAVGISPTLAAVQLRPIDHETAAAISGAAVFKQDKLVGFLEGEETKAMLFVKDRIKGGILVVEEPGQNAGVKLSLEILKNKSKLKPRYADGKITIEIETRTEAALDENEGRRNYIEETEVRELQNAAQAQLEGSIQSVVKKVQEEYGCDIFGFGKAVRLAMPELWKQELEAKWDDLFKTVQVEVHSEVNINNTAYQSGAVKVGD